MPNANDFFHILDWGTLEGTFATPLQLPSLPGGLIWDTTQLYMSGVLTVGGVLGDYNLDGAVDAADYTVWRDQLGATGLTLAADGNADGEVTHADYEVWRSHFGETVPTMSGVFATVPEPSTMLLMLTVVAASLVSTSRAVRMRAWRSVG